MGTAWYGINITLTVPLDSVLNHFQRGEFILAFYKDNRVFEAKQPKHVEKVELKETYSINARMVKDSQDMNLSNICWT